MKKYYCLKCQRIVDSTGSEVLADLDPDPESIDFCNSCNDDPESTINFLLNVIEKNRHHIGMSIEEELIRDKYDDFPPKGHGHTKLEFIQEFNANVGKRV